LDEFFHAPILHADGPERLDQKRNAGKLSEHASVPLTSGFQRNTLINHTSYKRHLSARDYHLDHSSCAGGMRRASLFCGGRKEFRRRRVEWRIADGEIDAGIMLVCAVST
jgi:hypothetical protein